MFSFRTEVFFESIMYIMIATVYLFLLLNLCNYICTLRVWINIIINNIYVYTLKIYYTVYVCLSEIEYYYYHYYYYYSLMM